MIRRILLSVLMITIAVSAVAAATSAYFSNGQVLGNNTFATGNVNLGGFNVANLTVTGLTPGVPVVISNVGISYTGDINADLYVGARGGSTAPGDPKYLADKTYLRIYYQGTSSVAWEGYVQQLSTVWGKIADNTTAGWKAYDLQFTLDVNTNNTHQGVSNTDTEILIYAVQHGGSVPATLPWQITGYDGKLW